MCALTRIYVCRTQKDLANSPRSLLAEKSFFVETEMNVLIEFHFIPNISQFCGKHLFLIF